ncbi:MAG: carbamate kinase [Alphaproteobacteria bacterium]|nr:carbamate kinase [Alphaproteobacteria bacterium]MCB9795095.1 carbamate kinase [Alphaproteobacteria bacterium]
MPWGRLTVIAIGGNSLLDPELPLNLENQAAVTARAMVPIADFIERSPWPDRVIITHGNGPQVGFQALRSELSRDHVFEVPLDSLVADTQGSLGYMIQRALREELRRRGLPFQVVSMVTEVEVDPEDQAFREPTKPIGRFYSEAEAELLSRRRGWKMVDDSHRGWRRVVPSPAPVRVVQLDSIGRLTEAGTVVICCGGGGIPVMRDAEGHIRGLEAVVDKDRASALMGARLGAHTLIITTGVDGVYKDYLTPERQLLRELDLDELNRLEAEGQFPPGSMGPKVKAADRFLRHGGAEVIICRPEQLVEAWEGRAGTRITRAQSQ